MPGQSSLPRSRKRYSPPSVITATVTHVRNMPPEEFEAFVGNPLRDATDAELWARICTHDPETIGLLAAEGSAHANEHGAGLDLDDLTLTAWSAWTDYEREIEGPPASRLRLGERLLREGVAAGVLRADLDIDLVYRFIRDTVWVAVNWYRPGGSFSAAQVADQYVTILLDGLGA